MASGEGKICVVAGKTAGSIVRKTTRMKNTVARMWRGSETAIEQTYLTVKGGCHKFGNLCTTVVGRGSIAGWEEKEKDIITRLGSEIWGHYQRKDTSPLFEQESVKRLIARLELYESNVKKRAADLALQKKRMDELAIFRQATANLESSHPGVRKVAIRVLGKLGNKRAIPYLNRMLDDPHADVRQRAADVLHTLIDSSLQPPAVTTTEVTELKKLMQAATVPQKKGT